MGKLMSGENKVSLCFLLLIGCSRLQYLLPSACKSQQEEEQYYTGITLAQHGAKVQNTAPGKVMTLSSSLINAVISLLMSHI